MWQVPSGNIPLGRGIGKGGFSSGTPVDIAQVIDFETRADLAAAIPNALKSYVRVGRYATGRELDIAIYKRGTSAGTLAVADASGQYWEYAENSMASAFHFGAYGNGINEDSTFLQAMLTYCKAEGAVAFIPIGTYLVSAALKWYTIGSQFEPAPKIMGAGQNLTIIDARQNGYVFDVDGAGGPSLTVNVSAVTQASPGVVTTSSNHGITLAGTPVDFASIGGMTNLNSGFYYATPLTNVTFALYNSAGAPVNTAAFPAYTNGGTVTTSVANYNFCRGGYITDLKIDGSNTASNNTGGIRWRAIFHFDMINLRITNMSANCTYGYGTDAIYGGDADSCNFIYQEGNSFDNSLGYGIIVQSPTGFQCHSYYTLEGTLYQQNFAGAEFRNIQQVYIKDCYFGLNKYGGLQFPYNGGFSQNIKIMSSEFQANGGSYNLQLGGVKGGFLYNIQFTRRADTSVYTNYQISNITQANPGVVTTGLPHGLVNGDSVWFGPGTVASFPSDTAVQSITQANPGVVTTATAHGITSDMTALTFLSVGGMVSLNTGTYYAVPTSTTTFELHTSTGANLDTSAFPAYTTGGTLVISAAIDTIVGMTELGYTWATVTVLTSTTFELKSATDNTVNLDTSAFTAYVRGGVTRTYTLNITNITQANPGIFTTNVAHGLSTGRVVKIAQVCGMTQINNQVAEVVNISATTFSLRNIATAVGIDTSAYTAYASSGVVNYATQIGANGVVLGDGTNLTSGIEAHAVRFTIDNEPTDVFTAFSMLSASAWIVNDPFYQIFDFNLNIAYQIDEVGANRSFGATLKDGYVPRYFGNDTTGATLTPDLIYGEVISHTVSSGVALTVNIPQTYQFGWLGREKFELHIANATGGAITPTFDTGAGGYITVSPSVGSNRIRTCWFRYNQTRDRWIQVGDWSPDLTP